MIFYLSLTREGTGSVNYTLELKVLKAVTFRSLEVYDRACDPEIQI